MPIWRRKSKRRVATRPRSSSSDCSTRSKLMAFRSRNCALQSAFRSGRSRSRTTSSATRSRSRGTHCRWMTSASPSIRCALKWKRTTAASRIWFAGVHSDVGGGYPEDDLAHVPLTWMIGELGNSLRFIDGTTETYARNASPYASAHDSRGGLSVFYRYGPRTIGDNGGQPPVVHHSVAEKIAFGIERYAPVALPATAKVLMPDGSEPPIAGYKSDAKWPSLPEGTLPSPQERAETAVRKLHEPDPDAVSQNLINIGRRRFAYSSLLATVLVIASLPWTVRPGIATFRDGVRSIASWFGLEAKWDQVWAGLADADQGGSATVGSFINYIGNLLPSYAKPWAEALVDRPTVCIIFIIIAAALYGWNSILRDRIANVSR